MPITGTVPVTGRIAPISDAAVYPVTDPQWGLGGLRSVNTTAERNQITTERRQVGMMVYVADENQYYTLVSGISNANWEIFQTGTGGTTIISGSDFYGLTGITSSEYPFGLSTTGLTGDRLLIATGPPNDPFRQYIRFGNAWVQTGIVGIQADLPRLLLIDTVSTTIDQTILKGSSAYSLNGDSILLTYAGGIAPATGCAFLTDPSKGSGFPVYFSSASMTGIDFTSQTLTAAVGDSVTIRVVVTGPAPYTSDSYDYEVVFGNELRWGATSGASLTGNQIQTILTNAVVKETPDHDFSLNMNYGDYLYFSYPARLGNTIHSINNAGHGGMSLQGTWVVGGSSPVMTTNSNGFTEAFYVYRSNQGLGELLRVKTEAI